MFIFSLEFILSMLNILKVNFRNQILFLVYSKSNLQYMKEVINILERDDVSFKVIFFDKDEKILDSHSNYVYIHPYLSSLLRAKLVITTSVQLKKEKFPLVKKLSHLPHSIVSLHMIYPEKSFNGFDYIFCSGKHHLEEIKEINKLYGCSICGLKSGYIKLDRLHQRSKMRAIDENEKKIILLAPSWGADNILESIGESLIDAIILKDYILIIRPHPIFFIEKKDIIEKLREKCDNINIFLENSTDDDDSFFKADIMISDYSGVAFEFAFLREKPILFIDVPKKVLNINYQDMDAIPIEVALRDKIGIIADPKIEDILDSLENIIQNPHMYKKPIRALREDLLFNYLHASNIVVNQIKKIIKE